MLQDDAKRPRVIKYGLNHVTRLIEEKKVITDSSMRLQTFFSYSLSKYRLSSLSVLQAKLVVIAHDVDPIELVIWLPALCRRMDVPYCVVKGKVTLSFCLPVRRLMASVGSPGSARPQEDGLGCCHHRCPPRGRSSPRAAPGASAHVIRRHAFNLFRRLRSRRPSTRTPPSAGRPVARSWASRRSTLSASASALPRARLPRSPRSRVF